MRRRVLEIVAARPGISVREIARRAETTWPNAKYHVMRLEQAGLVGTRLVGRQRVVFALDQALEGVIEARALLAEPTARRIALYVIDHPGGSIADVIRATGDSQRVVYYHLKRFIEAGLVEHSNEARYRGIRPTPLLFRAMV